MDHEDFLLNLNENLILKPVDQLKNENLISGLVGGEINFLRIVESLQGVLTNENVTVQEKGIEFLSWVLSNLPDFLFNESEIVVIVQFYCNCLKGHHNIIPVAIKGLQALVKMKNIVKEEILKILVHLFQHVNCQTQLQPDRYNIYSLLKYVIENHTKDIKQMGPDFVYGVISFIEGESDPICLLLIFQFLPFFIKNFDLGHLHEELFEVLSCYFPIDFNSAAKDNIMISREDLSVELIHCLAASDSFSEQCIPMILDKLDSTLKVAKLDSYKLLQECCNTLRVESLQNHLNELWKNLVKDVLPGNEKQVCDAGLLALTDIIDLLSKEESHQNILSNFLEDILTTVKSMTNRVDENMFQPAIRVLIATSARSKIATTRILYRLKPFYQLYSTQTTMEKKIILSSFLPFLKFCNDFKVLGNDDVEVVSSYLELVNLYFKSTTSDDSEIRKLAFIGISELYSDLSLEFKKILSDIVIENIKTREDIKTSTEFLKVWRNLAQDHQMEFHNILFNDFSSKLLEPHMPRFLWALSLIADLPNFMAFVIQTFVKTIVSSENCVIGLECLLNACRFVKRNSSNFYQVIHVEHNILETLISWYMKLNCQGNEFLDKQFLSMISEIIALVMRNQQSSVQQIFVDQFTQTFLNDCMTVSGGENLSSQIFLDPSHESAKKVLIVEAVLGSIRPEVTVPNVIIILEKLINLALNSAEDSVRLSSSRLCASFVNKSKEVSNLSSKILKNIFKQLEESSDSKVKLNCAFLCTWVIKGVILSGDSSSEEWISTWFDLLGRKDIGETIAEGFQTVMAEDLSYLNLESHCNVRVLYRQRLFVNFPTLIKMYETSDDSVKMNYLLALVRLLQGVPNHLIQTELSKIVILLVRCLDTNKSHVLLTSLEILSALLERREKIFLDHVQSFVPRFLKLSRFEDCMKIRINALTCLYFYGFYPTIAVLPIKNEVIHDLEHCLDDRKRLVRKEAVRARCRWFLIGAPGENILDS